MINRLFIRVSPAEWAAIVVDLFLLNADQVDELEEDARQGTQRGEWSNA